MLRIIILKYGLIIFISFLLSCNQNKSSDDNEYQYQITIKLVENRNNFEYIFPYVKDSLGIIVVFFGLLFTYPLLKKKLIENHISNTLQNIQDFNRKIQNECQKLIDKYEPLTYSSNKLRKPAIENVYDEIKTLYYTSQQSSSDVVTVLYYLKNTLQGVLKHYEYGKYSIITTRDLHGLTISILELTVFYCSKVVQIPKSTKIEYQNIVNPKLKKLVINSSNKQYKYFNQGVIYDVRTSHLGFFYDEVNKRNHPLIKRAAFRIFADSTPIANLLYLHEIYAPLVLEKEYDSPFVQDGTLRLYLIGFSFQNKLTMHDNTVCEVVDMDYSNPDDFGRFTDKLTLNDFKTNFKDTYIKDSEFSFERITMKHSNIETLRIQINSQYLKNKFKSLKKSLVNEMKKTKPNNLL